MKDTTDFEKISSLQTALQEMIRNSVEAETPDERGTAKLGAIDLATQICEIAKQGDAPVYLINITRKRHLCKRTYASYWIAGCEENQPYAATVIAPATGWRDAGFGGEPFSVKRFGEGWKPKGSPLYYRASQVAEDLCQEINGDLPNFQTIDFSQTNSQGPRLQKTMGVFISQTRIPSKDNLNAASLLYRAYCNALVMDGNLIFEQTHDYRKIGSLHHEAARTLGIENDWHQDYASRVTCEGCGERILSTVARCPTCKWIINEQKVREQIALETQLAAPKGNRQQATK